MVNHLRTLLLNISSSVVSSAPGEEYVPAGYVAQPYLSNLDNIRILLFGTGADRAMMNVRLKEVMAILHSSELASYVTALDARITYWPPHDTRVFRDLVFGATAYQQIGTTTNISILGDTTAWKSNSLYRQWRLTMTDSTHILIDTLVEPISSTSQAVTFTDGLSNTIALPESNLSVTVSSTGASLPSWVVTGFARPAYTITDVMAAFETIGSPDYLFSAAEPYKTFKKLWENKYLPTAYRLGSFILALGYQLDNVFQGNSNG